MMEEGLSASSGGVLWVLVAERGWAHAAGASNLERLQLYTHPLGGSGSGTGAEVPLRCIQ